MNNNLNQNLNQKTIEWPNIQKDMKLKFGTDIYDSWLKKIDFVEEFKNYILISVSTRFIRDWIASRYLDQILQIVNSYNKQVKNGEQYFASSVDNLADFMDEQGLGNQAQLLRGEYMDKVQKFYFKWLKQFVKSLK